VTPLPNLAPTWNMAPSMDAPVVLLIDGERYLDALKWGLMPYLTKDLKNGATIPTEPSSAMQDGPSLRG